MNLTDVPLRIGTKWGASAGAGFIRTVPVASQIGILNGAASFADGFPPLNFQPIESGGVPPFGQDTNGILNVMSAWLQWTQAGNPIQYDVTFSTAISGYPKGAVLQSTQLGKFWINGADANTNNPDSVSTNWMKAFPGVYFGADTGAANVYSCSFTPPLTAHEPGLLISLGVGNTNTGASTFNPTNTGVAKTIKLPTGESTLPGMLRAGSTALLVYDGTYYQFINPGPIGGRLVNVATGVPVTIPLPLQSAGGSVTTNTYIVGVGWGGPTTSYAIVVDIGGLWLILSQGTVTAASGAGTFSVSGANLQYTHNYGVNTDVCWNAQRSFSL